MADNGPLIVPIEVEALVVNDGVRTSTAGANLTGFQRWQMVYAGLNRYANVEPAAFGGNDLDFLDETGSTPIFGTTISGYYNGVYLKWRLPEALRAGVQDSASGTTTFPLVPNRWLVVRTSGPLTARTVAAWVVQSDYQYATAPSSYTSYGAQASAFAVANSTGGQAALIGQNTALTGQGWSEPGGAMFLTAIGPGNPAFASYQPHNVNVFSFMDPLDSVQSPGEQLTYQVIGWYSDPTQDPLAQATTADFTTVLDDLEWGLPTGTDPTLFTNSSLYTGLVSAVPWATAAAPTQGGAPQTTAAFAVGNTSAEAVAALVATQVSAEGESGDVDPDLLEAFQLGLLRVYDEPGGPALLAQKLQASAFQALAGGYGWELVDAPASTPPDATELANEDTWLAALNQAQATYDAATRTLAALQSQLFVMWWKAALWSQANVPDSPPFTQAQVQAQLDPTVSTSLAGQVQAAQTNVTTLQATVPWGDTQDSLVASIAAYATQQSLPASRVLKRYKRPDFSAPNDPVVLLLGAGAWGIPPEAAETLTCRFPSQLVTGFNYAGNGYSASASGLTIPAPTIGTLTGVAWASSWLTPLLQEAFFLDPLNATQFAAEVLDATDSTTIAAVATAMGDPTANAIGTPPVCGLAPWAAQPWRPVFLMWEAQYYPIDYGTPSAPNWSWNGEGLSWNGQGAATGSPLSLSGRILLTPQASVSLQNQLQAFLAQNPNLDPTELAAITELTSFMGQYDVDTGNNSGNWDFLSQSLDGFNAQLLQQGTGAFASGGTGPQGAALSALIGPADSYPPQLGNFPNPPDVPATTTFQPWRCGQFVFTQLAVVDEWGQTIFYATPEDADQLTVALPADLTPAAGQSLITSAPNAVVQLPPALLQAGRLDFDLVSATDDSQVLGVDSDVNPICGWVLPNHLDGSLMAYDNGGTLLGELVPSLDTGAGVVWLPAPNGQYASVSDLSSIPHFGPFLIALQALSTPSFTAFLTAIDETQWTTAPAGVSFDSDLVALVGRPLALTRARVMFELAQTPELDPNWQFTFSASPSPVNTYSFAIQLGDTSTQLADGLVGYFAADSYGQFNVVPQSGVTAGEDAYLAPIGPGGSLVTLPFDGQTAEYLSLLVDPRAAVNANTGILPAVSLALPAPFVDSALAAMNITFRIGPVLTDSRADAAGNTTLLVPRPAGNLGTWAWLENDDAGWTTYPLATPGTTARLSSTPPVLRTGLLQLSSALNAGGGGSGDVLAARPFARARKSARKRP